MLKQYKVGDLVQVDDSQEEYGLPQGSIGLITDTVFDFDPSYPQSEPTGYHYVVVRWAKHETLSYELGDLEERVWLTIIN